MDGIGIDEHRGPSGGGSMHGFGVEHPRVTLTV